MKNDNPFLSLFIVTGIAVMMIIILIIGTVYGYAALTATCLALITPVLFLSVLWRVLKKEAAAGKRYEKLKRLSIPHGTGHADLRSLMEKDRLRQLAKEKELKDD